MAMLAEPRKKQKWSVDPRNSAWSKDESKFGQKILEKMGWSKGKGLGVQEQGSTEHIKVQVKNNTLGLGAAINYEDNWIAHQDDFNQLLAELNNCHRQGESEPSSEQKKTFSLEEKSRSSRKRVHYVKFAKGKDLSSRSEDDLSCIFGKRQNTKTEEDNTCADSPEEDRKEDHGMANPVDHSNTVTSTMTVQEYFAKRMAKLKKFQKEPESELADPGTTAAEDLESSQGLKTRSKKKSRKNAEAENVNSYEEPKVKRSRTDGLWEEELETANTEYQSRKKKKKAKDPRKGEDVSCDGNSCVFPGSGEIYLGTSDRKNLGEEDSEIKQKKPYKKKHKKQKKEAAEYVDGMQRKNKKHLS
ncbi:PIN2/TERF1-interacting telomerase inhibitor 1 isoform X1 [Gopherus flavomarginatus]|uniref:PIN2/TERF1-interacting telomerase inhibitor 1 isoform X1 n=2 Tax=Gopherus flavomarginatus TaxID=286002 RepID=UPI0021CC1CB3|nr:PIN2/TERF1-interacting telomerase inhibitor 1 isoform X1 [Gopherus flavomarginatus]